MPRPIGRSVVEAAVGDGAVGSLDRERVVLHRNRRRVVRVLLLRAPPEVRPDLHIGLEQQSIGVRRRPRDLREAAGMVLVSLQRLSCGDQSGERETGARTAGIAVQAVVMQVRPADDLVARRHLPRQADGMIPPFAVVFRLLAEIGRVRPLGVIAGVQVVPHAGDGLYVPLIAVAREEPQAIALDRPAEGRVDVVQLFGLQRR